MGGCISRDDRFADYPNMYRQAQFDPKSGQYLLTLEKMQNYKDGVVYLNKDANGMPIYPEHPNPFHESNQYGIGGAHNTCYDCRTRRDIASCIPTKDIYDGSLTYYHCNDYSDLGFGCLKRTVQAPINCTAATCTVLVDTIADFNKQTWNCVAGTTNAVTGCALDTIECVACTGLVATECAVCTTLKATMITTAAVYAVTECALCTTGHVLWESGKATVFGTECILYTTGWAVYTVTKNVCKAGQCIICTAIAIPAIVIAPLVYGCKKTVDWCEWMCDCEHHKHIEKHLDNYEMKHKVDWHPPHFAPEDHPKNRQCLAGRCITATIQGFEIASIGACLSAICSPACLMGALAAEAVGCCLVKEKEEQPPPPPPKASYYDYDMNYTYNYKPATRATYSAPKKQEPESAPKKQEPEVVVEEVVEEEVVEEVKEVEYVVDTGVKDLEKDASGFLTSLKRRLQPRHQDNSLYPTQRPHAYEGNVSYSYRSTV